MDPMEDRLLTLQEVADHARVPLESVRAWRKRGRGPKFLKVGAHLRVRESDYRAWLESCATK